jgi:hypothetical protein
MTTGMDNLEKTIVIKAKLLSLISNVSNKETMNGFIADFNKYLPKESHIIIVVGAMIKRRYCISVITNNGWSTGWIVIYNQQKLYAADPIWNGPCNELMIWSHLLKNPSLSLRKKYVSLANSENLKFGVSWKNIIGEKTFVISIKGEAIEKDEFSHYIIKSIGRQLVNAAIRVVGKHPEIITLSNKEYQAFNSMFQHSSDVDAADNSGMTLDSYRYTIKEIQKRFAAKNRYDMIKKVYCLP